MAKVKTVKAWHVYHYAELFRAVGGNGGELETVKYSQRPISGFSEFAEQHIQQIEALRQALPFTEYVIARQIFEELLDHSQKHHKSNKYLRGYILDERLRPAAPLRIAQIIGCDKKTIDTFLPILERVGLIERAAVPAPPKTGTDTPSPKPEKKKKTAAKKTAGKTASKQASNGKKRTNPAKNADLEPADAAGDNQVTQPSLSFFKGEEEGEGEGLRRTDPQLSASGLEEENKNLQPAASGQGAAAAAPPRPGKGKGKTPAEAGCEGTGKPGKDEPEPEPEPEPEEQAEHETSADANGKAPPEQKPPTTPATTPLRNLTNLTKTDGPVGGNIRISDMLDSLYDPSGYAFAEAVYRAIETPGSMDTPNGRSEIEASASAWQRAVRAGLKPSQLEELWHKTIKRARHHGQRRKRQPKAYRIAPEAVLMHEFNKRLSALRLRNTAADSLPDECAKSM